MKVVFTKNNVFKRDFEDKWSKQQLFPFEEIAAYELFHKMLFLLELYKWIGQSADLLPKFSQARAVLNILKMSIVEFLLH